MGLRSGLVKPASEQSPLLAKGCSSQRAPVHVGAAATPPTALPPHTQRVLHVVLAVFYAVSLGACVYVVMGLAGAVPFMTGTPRSRQLLVGIGAAATALAIPLTVYDILCHLLGYVNPLQRYYVRVLWMVIIYACESLTALSMPNDRQYYENMVSCYEAFTVYSFYRLCLDFLGPRLDVERALESGAFRPGSGPKKSKWARVLIDGNCWSKEEEGEEGGGAAEALVPGKPRFAHMLAPCCCLRPWRMGADFLNATSIGVVQYVVVRIACAVATFALQSIDKYGENELTNPAVGYPWIVIVINTSQCWALYCLIMFGYHLWEPLGPLKPMGKVRAAPTTTITTAAAVCGGDGRVLTQPVSVPSLPPFSPHSPPPRPSPSPPLPFHTVRRHQVDRLPLLVAGRRHFRHQQRGRHPQRGGRDDG